jgi:hypothetical protein
MFWPFTLATTVSGGIGGFAAVAGAVAAGAGAAFSSAVAGCRRARLERARMAMALEARGYAGCIGISALSLMVWRAPMEVWPCVVVGS